MSTHNYKGEYRSAIARAKKILLAAGFKWSTTTGRYQPFANKQITTRGVRVTRIGCSETISVSAWWYHNELSGEERRWVEALAIATLRENGMAFDDRGWLACGRDAVKTEVES